MHQSLLSVKKVILRTKVVSTAHVSNGYLVTNALSTVVENVEVDLLLSTGFIEYRTLPILIDKQKATYKLSIPAAIVKQQTVSANAVFTKVNRRNADKKTNFDARKRSNLDHQTLQHSCNFRSEVAWARFANKNYIQNKGERSSSL